MLLLFLIFLEKTKNFSMILENISFNLFGLIFISFFVIGYWKVICFLILLNISSLLEIVSFKTSCSVSFK